MTVLGEFVRPNGGAAWTQTLVGALGLLGVRDKAARQAIARMHERGWLDRERVGRQTRWGLTEHATELLEAGADRIYEFGRSTRTWDRRWLVVLARVPQRDRNVRYRMGVGLSWAGFGSLGQGVWVSPWTDQEPVAVRLLDGLDVEATTFRAELGSLGSGPEVATAAWDLPSLREQYDAFLARTAPPVPEDRTDEEAAATLATLVHQWRRFPFLDPDLPADLLPDDWPGPEAAERFVDRRRALVDDAGAWWRSIEAAFTPSSTVGADRSREQ